MPVLKQVTGELAGRLVDLTGDVTAIGRLPECDVVLSISGVSRRHAEIRKVGAGFCVVDLGSRNKTLVNDTALEGGVEHLLKENDRINICGNEFTYHSTPPPEKKEREPGSDFVEVTESDGSEKPDFRTLEAARSSTMASARLPTQPCGVRIYARLRVASLQDSVVRPSLRRWL